MYKDLKPIKLSAHAQIQAQRRGAKEDEIIDTIRNAQWQTVEGDRLECRKDIIFNNTWNGKAYKVKQVRPIFVDEKDSIVVVTVYVYYF